MSGLRAGGPVWPGQVMVLPAGGRILPVRAKPTIRCAHRQAEPVILSTGETVACVCVECYEAVPSDWVDRQHKKAEAMARCPHDDLVDITSFDKIPGSETICAGCGAHNP